MEQAAQSVLYGMPCNAGSFYAMLCILSSSIDNPYQPLESNMSQATKKSVQIQGV